MLDDMVSEAAGRGLALRTIDDAPLDGRVIGLDGRPHLNFGSCSYLGLELDPRMRDAVCDAVMRYGTQFSSSRSYLSAPAYAELESNLEQMFGGHVIVAPSTSLGHLAALPVLVGSDDIVLLDQQVHQSVQMAANQLRAQGTRVELIRHNRMDRLEAMIERFAPAHHHVWYLADGVYSMFADLAPFAELSRLLDRHEQLHLYVDDSHGVGWAGRHGRGPTLEQLGNHQRMVVAGSLNKSFAAAGGALIFPDAELERRVRTVGGPMIFSGPVQPPMLGAALASSRIHLSPELAVRQDALRARISLCTELLEEFCLPLQAHDVTPIRYVMLGLPSVAQDVVSRLLDDGIYTNLATFPAVPMKQAGVRITLTLHHQPEDIRALVEALARHVPAALAAAGAAAARAHAKASATAGRTPAAASAAAPTPSLRLEHHRSIAALDAREWDRLLGDRGTFTAEGLRFLEQAFGRPAVRQEDDWAFHYYVVRDQRGTPVLATFFTAALWKDDLLAPAAVSRRVEERRIDEPYYLTSQTFAMGALLTEGDHLYLDRTADWHGALDLLCAAIAEDAEAAGAGTIVLRDLDGSPEVAEALGQRGFTKMAMPDSLIVDPVVIDDRGWMAGLSAKARSHQRREVLPWDGTFELEVLRPGERVPADAELAYLHELYRNVELRGLEVNSFELPPTILRDMLAYPCWELMLMYLPPAAGGPAHGLPVGFGAHFIGKGYYAPMLLGLDYAYVRSHHSYRQALRQAMQRARAHGGGRMLLGMGAALEKRRFGARPHQRFAYVQASDHYSQEVLAALEADMLGTSV